MIRLAALSILTVSMIASTVFAVKLDMETHNALLERLEEVRAGLDASDASYVPTALRIADLLADRARLLDMQAMEKSQTASPEARADRQKAIALIESVEGRADSELRNKALLQKSQLMLLLGGDRNSEQTLLRVKNNSARGSEDYMIAIGNLADYYFSKGQYKAAIPYYAELQSSQKANDFNEYRLAWCELNLGRENQAVARMENILNKSNLEPSLRKETARDIVLFYARQPFSPDTIEKVRGYSPKEDLQENMKLYAEEMRRLGKKQGSSVALGAYLDMVDRDDMSLVARADLFENLADIGQRERANKVLKQIVSKRCGDQCPDVQMRLHRALRSWGNQELSRPTQALSDAFRIYAEMRPFDQAAILFGIKLFQDAKLHNHALPLLAVIIDQTKDEKILESALQAQIASAQKSNSPQAKESALQAYLDRGRDHNLKKEIQQDLIQAMMDNKNWRGAESIARNVYSQKNDKDIGTMLVEIYTKSNQSEKQMDHLVVMAGHEPTAEKKFRMLNDAFLLAFQKQDFRRLKSTSEELAAIGTQLNPKLKNLAYEKRILVADLELDYATSLEYDKRMMVPNTAERIFRLAFKSRLAGKPNWALEQQIMFEKRFYKQQRLWVLENQVNESSYPFSILAKHQDLVRNPQIHSRFVLTAMAKQGPYAAQTYIKARPQLRGTFVDLLAARRGNIDKVLAEFGGVGRVNLSYRSVAIFGASLERKIAALKAYERTLRRVSRDTIAHMFGKSYLAVLNQNLAEQLEMAKTNLKVTPQIKVQFDSRIDAQIRQLNYKSQALDREVAAQWRSQRVDAEFMNVLALSSSMQKRAIVAEVKYWQKQSPNRMRDLFSRIADVDIDDNRSNSSSSSYSDLRRNPFQKGLSTKLAREEEARGNYGLSVYLADREKRLRGI